MLHISGTLLASGSDDLDIHIWNWRESKTSYSFTTGHRSNVFQVPNDSNIMIIIIITHLYNARGVGPISTGDATKGR